jgi:uncharacterized membrane protein
MLEMVLLILLLIFGKISNLIQKKVFMLYPKINIYVILTLIGIISLIVVNYHCLVEDSSCYNNIFDKDNIGGLLLIILSGIILGVVNIYFYPLYKKYDYAAFKILKDPINMAIVITGSVLFLGERPNKNTYLGLILFLCGAYISNKGVVK